jgi:hypothetical protein
MSAFPPEAALSVRQRGVRFGGAVPVWLNGHNGRHSAALGLSESQTREERWGSAQNDSARQMFVLRKRAAAPCCRAAQPAGRAPGAGRARSYEGRRAVASALCLHWSIGDRKVFSRRPDELRTPNAFQTRSRILVALLVAHHIAGPKKRAAASRSGRIWTSWRAALITLTKVSAVSFNVS